MEHAGARFTPPFCPSHHCRFHLGAAGWHWVRHGTYPRRCEPRSIPRFRCRHCGVTFSSQTFSTTYYLKRPELQIPLFHRLIACSGYRQMAREMRCSPTSLMGQAARLGRHALLVLHHLRPRSAPKEPLVIDGFESFAYSQYHPLHLNLAVGAESHYVYGFTHAELRRKGSMREAQRRKRAALEQRYGRPDPKAIEHGVADLLRLAAPEPTTLVVRSDEHPAYPRALHRLKGWTIRHERTPSVQARTPGNPLFPVNLMDLLLRHNSANHKRETIAFSKRRQSAAERLWLTLVWRNYVKSFSERKRDATPAMRAAVCGTRWSLQAILAERRFISQVQLPERWERYYWGRTPTRGLPRARAHTLRYAA